MLDDRSTRQFVKSSVDCPLTDFNFLTTKIFSVGTFSNNVQVDSPSLTFRKNITTDNHLTRHNNILNERNE